MLIAIAISSGMAMGFLVWVQFFNSSIGSMTKNDQAEAAFLRAISAFGNDDRYCEFILKGKTFSPATGITLPTIDYHDDLGNYQGRAVTVGEKVQPNSEVVTKSINVRNVVQLAPNYYYTFLQLTFNRASSTAAGNPYVREIPVTIVTDSSNIVKTCSTSANSKLIVQDRICEINSDGFETFDPVINGCKMKAGVQWITPNPNAHTTAQCPAGMIPAVSPLNPNGADIACDMDSTDMKMVPPRQYTNGTIDNSKIAIYNSTMTQQNKICNFSWAIDNGTASAGTAATGVPTTIITSTILPANAHLYTAKIKCAKVTP